MNNRVGQILIAHPKLPTNTPFHKTVVYIFNDGPREGTQGIVLNKPTHHKVNDVISKQGYELPLNKERMRFGGPVSTNTLFMLHTDDFESASSMPVGNGLMISCDDFMIEKMAMGHQPNLWRMMVGLASWQPKQLELELNGKPPFRPENSWLTAVANCSILFEQDGEKQWEKALELSSRQMINSYF